ncbi:MAG: prolyl oligopeptidase family serine peptidase [Kofleriaceae bacterium]
MRFALCAAVLATACGSTPPPQPAPPPKPVIHVPSDPEPVKPVPTAAVRPKDAPPLARVEVVKDTYHGVVVEDPYRWLEGDTDEAKAWSEAHNTYARTVIEALPDYATFKDELTKILNAPVTTYARLTSAGSKLFALRRQSGEDFPSLVVMTDPDRTKQAKVVAAPATAEHPRRAIDFFRPSQDGSKVAIAESDDGSERADIHIVETATGKELDVIPRAQRATAGGDVAWAPDGKSVYVTRYPDKGQKPDDELDLWLTVWTHVIGQPIEKDTQEPLADLPKTAEIQLESDSRGRVIASVQLGDGGVFRHYLKDAGGWRMLDDWDDKIVHVTFGPTPDLWLVSKKDAPRGKIARLAAKAKTSAEGVIVVPEGKDSIETDYPSKLGVRAIGDRIFANYQLGGPTELRVFSTKGKALQGPPTPTIANVGSPIAWRDDVLVGYSSYTSLPVVMKWSPKSNKATKLADFTPAYPVDLSNLDVRREMATSKDGTNIPVNIIWPKGAPQDGTVPCVVSGYGGFSISTSPSPQLQFVPLTLRGFCIVQVNLRGGAEFGEDWHRNGMLLKKQNVFDDFAAALDYLVAKHYTNRQRLAILGGSNGGLLMGAMITQHPDAMKAVVSTVGIYDMLRTELTANGQFNTTEYGSVKDEDQFKALFAYSPYHHVGKGIAYPAIWMHTGAHDDRVQSWQSRKMIAALEAANSGSAPILLHTSQTAGHGMGSGVGERIALLATELAFIRWQLQAQ